MPFNVPKPTPQERAKIRAVTGCDDSTIRNVFAVLRDEPSTRKPSEVSTNRVLNGAREIGLDVPPQRSASTCRRRSSRTSPSCTRSARLPSPRELPDPDPQKANAPR
jgi:hypothetical protein